MIEPLLERLLDAAASLLLIMLCLGGLLLLRIGRGAGAPQDRSLETGVRTASAAARHDHPPVQPSSVFQAIPMVGLTLLAAGLLAATVLAWQHATPTNGLLLVAGIFGLLTLLAFAAIFIPSAKEQEVETWAPIADEASRRAISPRMFFLVPEVHRLGDAAVARAERMRHGGASLDTICATLDSGYRGWDETHRRAFRATVESALAEQLVRERAL